MSTATATPRTVPHTTRPQSSVSRWANHNRKWVLAAPAMIFTAAMILFPLGWTLYLSLTNAKGSVRAEKEFIGFDNYASVFADTARFWPAVGRTLFFTGGTLVAQLVLGMVIALLLRKNFRGQGFVRIAVLMPLVATPVAVGMMWRLIFEPNIGIVNYLLVRMGIPAQPWLAGENTALPTTMIIDIWQWTPMVALILLAGLTSIPEEMDEAASIDGASAWQRFWHVTLPILWPSVVVATLLRGIDALKTFDILYATKGRGGGSFNEVETLNVYAYGLSFDYNNYGIASAVLILFFGLILLALFLLVRGNKVK
ncbi:carbohydrate ABC transporter permease [Tessaracoccus oleiagri]|uniref:Multiple sugar transport system permease protein n=1 Tax=Tessaracoccus oleiagri TaxID=686624 RepID=A0A1G9H241_9ACTN|nr:sugar ABC transporter permease [Tessaracoccus oleiagri]SDL07020.1 multiple sugar transport system permease protein [Tessaracoccus oleiagri]